MKSHHQQSTNRQRKALSLVEVAISTLLVGLLLVSAMKCLGGVLTSRIITGEKAQADQLAHQFLTEILKEKYIDGSLLGTFIGLDLGETIGNRTTFNDVDDFNGWSSSPPKRFDNSSMSHLTGWSREVSVSWVIPSNPSLISLVDLGVKKIVVTVKKDGVVKATATGLRTSEY